jgi:hypothetical protein
MHRPIIASLTALALLAGPTAAAGTGTPTSPSGAPTPTPIGDAIATAWLRMPESGHGCGDDLIFDYGVDGGMRTVFCRGLLVLSWKAVLAAAPSTPFLKGPHKGTTLDLQAARDFGRYDPAFVRWATRALVPAAKDGALRKRTQGVYDRQFQRLARVYFLVEKALSSSPPWVERERQRYLSLMDAKGGAWNELEITEPYHDTLGGEGANWGGHDPNHVRSATMWWLRRAHDGTRPIWSDGLQRLLQTYDGAWLAAQIDVRPVPLPDTSKAAQPVEYRDGP